MKSVLMAGGTTIGVALSTPCNVSIVDNSLEKLEQLRQTGTRHQLIAVACSINHAQRIRSLYEERGYEAGIIHSKQSEEEKEAVKQRLYSGVLDCIVQVAMLGEGFDHPKLSVAAIFRPFRSLAPYIQFVGRILRVVVQNDPLRDAREELRVQCELAEKTRARVIANIDHT